MLYKFEFQGEKLWIIRNKTKNLKKHLAVNHKTKSKIKTINTIAKTAQTTLKANSLTDTNNYFKAFSNGKGFYFTCNFFKKIVK